MKNHTITVDDVIEAQGYKHTIASQALTGKGSKKLLMDLGGFYYIVHKDSNGIEDSYSVHNMEVAVQRYNDIIL